MKSWLLWGTLLVLPSVVFAQRDARVPNPDPEREREALQVADGFEVNLFASDPLLAKPIQMNFDPQGRLWVACSAVYPQIKPGQKANDRVVVLEDTRGVGKADKMSVFADGLFIPTGIAPGDGGVYVANSTELIHLKDTRGTGHADERRVLLSGFGTEDTHHIIHCFRWGPDGMLYFNQSIYIHSHVETPHGVRRLGGGGVWQYRPETGQLDVFLHGFCNPWGHAFDRWGQSFVTDGAYSDGINYGLPGALYVFTPGAERILAGLNPGSPKHCGLEILSGRHLPPSWQGNMLTNDFRGHRVCRFVVKEDGAGYVSREENELIKTNHGAFRPVDIKMGPDGAIYIADWYNPIIQHGEVDFRDPRRDHIHGRIWRVTYKGRPLVPRPRLVGAPTTNLLEALKAPEDWTRQQAKRVLKERGPVILPELADWVRGLDPNDSNYEHNLLEGLWTYQSLDVVEPKLLSMLLHARDHHARAAAVRVLSYWYDRLPNSMEQLSERVADEHPQVRLEAVRALARLHQPQAIEIAMRALDRNVDKYVDYALWLTARELQPYWLPAYLHGKIDFEGNVAHVLYALKAANSPEIVPSLVHLLAQGKLRRGQQDEAFALIARLGGSKELGLVFERVLRGDGQGREIDLRLLASLEQAARERGVRPDGDLNRLGRLLSSNDDVFVAAAMRMAGLWKLESLRPRLMAFASAKRSTSGLRQAAIDGLARMGGPASKHALEELSGVDRPVGTRFMAVVGLASLDLTAAARHGAEALSADHGDADPTGLFTAFLQRKAGAAALAKALTGRSLSGDVAKLGIRAVRGTGQDVPVLVAALTKAGHLTTGPRNLNPAEMRAIVNEVVVHGDAGRGEVIFRRSDMLCLKCHAIAGAGGRVGPDLASIGGSAQVDYLVDSILVPNKAVKENYHSMLVTTKQGRLISGIKVQQTDKDLILRDAEDQEVAVPLASIDETHMGGSLMPDGLADNLTRSELVDLVRFLSELGKVGPYAVSKARLVRRWQVLQTTPPAWSAFYTSFGTAVSREGLTWTSAYSKVDGTLPLADLPRFPFHTPETKLVDTFGFTRCQLDVTTPGKVELKLNSARGLTCWVDGTPMPAKQTMALELRRGVHTVTWAVNLGQRTQGLRVEMTDVPGSSARASIISGK